MLFAGIVGVLVLRQLFDAGGHAVGQIGDMGEFAVFVQGDHVGVSHIEWNSIAGYGISVEARILDHIFILVLKLQSA